MPNSPRQPPILAPPIKLAVCVSGGGSTLQNLIDRISDGRLAAEIVQVVASRAGIGAIARAEKAGIPIKVVERRKESLAEFSAAVFESIRERDSDFVVLGGFLSLLEIPGDYLGCVLNVHPSLIPAFCGRGYHGASVHQAVIDAGVKVSGCTVHFADQSYDTGPIVLQKVVPVLDDDTALTLASRVFGAECEALPEAIRLYAQGCLRIEGRRVHIVRQV